MVHMEGPIEIEYVKKQMSKVFSSEDIIHDLENIQAHLINAVNSRTNSHPLSALVAQYNCNNNNNNNNNMSKPVILGPVWDSDQQELQANNNSDTINMKNEKPRTRHLGPELQRHNIIDADMKLGRSKVQRPSYYSKASAAAFNTKLDGFERRGQAWFLATELQSDLIVDVGDISFHLHKFPLISRSGRLNRLVFESRDTETDKIHLAEIPGGPEAFELACKFCYGFSVELTERKVAALRCAAEYLEMTEDLGENNLVAEAEAYLNMVVLASWKDSITVLQSCQKLQPWGEKLGIVKRCSESIAWKACMQQDHNIHHQYGVKSVILSKVQENGAAQNHNSAGNNKKLVGTLNNGRLDHNCAVRDDAKTRLTEQSEDWWVDDIVVGLSCVEYFVKVIKAIKSKGMKTELIGVALVKYAAKWIFCASEISNHSEKASNTDLGYVNNVREIVESLQDLICSCYFDFNHEISTDPADKTQQLADKFNTDMKLHGRDDDNCVNSSTVSCNFLLKLLQIACKVGASDACRAQLERRASSHLHQLRHSDLDLLLLFKDVALVQRLVNGFLQLHNLSRVDTSHQNDTIHRSKRINVACVLEAYLAEIGHDDELSFQDFYNLMQSLQSAAADVACHDGLYRAIDSFLKGHGNTAEDERTRLCQLIDFRKLSYQACMHVVHNDRLPLRVAMQILFFQLRPPPGVQSSTPAADTDCTSAGRARTGPNNYVDHTKAAARGGGYSLRAGRLAPETESTENNRSSVDMLRMEVESLKSKYAQLEADYNRLQRLNKNHSDHTSSADAATRRPANGSSSAPSWGSSLKKLGHLLHHRLSISADSATNHHHFNNHHHQANGTNNASVRPPNKLPPRSSLRNSIS